MYRIAASWEAQGGLWAMSAGREGDSDWAERFGRVEDATDGVDLDTASDDQGEQDASRWIDLGEAGAKLALATTRGDLLDLTEQSAAVIRALFGIEEAQARLLNSIDENVKLLLAEPFKSGREYLGMAQRDVNNPDFSRTYVVQARDKFIEAHQRATQPMDLAVVEVYIAVTLFLMGDLVNSQHNLRQAYEKSASMARELAVETGNTEVIKWVQRPSLKRYVATLVNPRYGFKVTAERYSRTAKNSIAAVRNAKLKRSNERAQKGLRALLPLLGCIASLNAAIPGADPTELPPLKLNPIENNRYELVAVTGSPEGT
jgi:hypothetical protein